MHDKVDVAVLTSVTVAGDRAQVNPVVGVTADVSVTDPRKLLIEERVMTVAPGIPALMTSGLEPAMVKSWTV